jgi:hypothetical protein
MLQNRQQQALVRDSDSSVPPPPLGRSRGCLHILHFHSLTRIPPGMERLAGLGNHWPLASLLPSWIDICRQHPGSTEKKSLLSTHCMHKQRKGRAAHVVSWPCGFLTGSPGGRGLRPSPVPALQSPGCWMLFTHLLASGPLFLPSPT